MNEEESMETVSTFNVDQVQDNELQEFIYYLGACGIPPAEIKIDVSNAGGVNIPEDDEAFVKGLLREAQKRGIRIV